VKCDLCHDIIANKTTHASMCSLLGTDRLNELSPEQQQFARSEGGGSSLLDVVKSAGPTILLGVTTVGGLFTEELIREMAAQCEYPLIFPLSNPTDKAECTAEQAYKWTDGKCVFGSGSPFSEVTLSDGRKFQPSQVNNVYIFPGLGLGATLAKATRITDKMLYIAAEALAKFISDEDIAQGKILPPLSKIRLASHAIACAVIREAQRDGLSRVDMPETDLEEYVAKKMYFPEYVPLVEKS
jgi:malate dehydrogenase (oxaloacetate-decarboxylating)(NADP+)